LRNVDRLKETGLELVPYRRLIIGKGRKLTVCFTKTKKDARQFRFAGRKSQEEPSVMVAVITLRHPNNLVRKMLMMPSEVALVANLQR
jgi:hypothetical protein